MDYFFISLIALYLYKLLFYFFYPNKYQVFNNLLGHLTILPDFYI